MKKIFLVTACALFVVFVKAAPAEIAVKGVDVSSLRKNEDFGARYFYDSGTQDDALKILRDGGANTARVRVWVNSPDGYHGKTQLLQIAQRVKKLGMKLLVDFHYSDTWADPGHQTKPEAWKHYDLAQLNKAVYQHTKEICDALVQQGTPADFVQIGNEINDGMLWPEGRVSSNGRNYSNLAQLVRSGVNAAKQAHDATRIVLHIAGFSQSWFDSMKAQGLDWDYTGVSYYTWWHGSFESLESNLKLAANRYGKPVLICETSYPWTLAGADSESNIIGQSSQLASGYPASMQGQYDVMRRVIDIVNRVPQGRGAGIIYWDGTWTAVSGNGWDNFDPKSGNNWENQALFDYSGQETWRIFR